MQYRLIRGIILIFFLLFIVACSKDHPKSDENVELTISAAASLKSAMDVIQNQFKEEHPEVTLKFNFGGSGSLQQQISQGAPVDFFFSAAEDKFDTLVVEGHIRKDDGIALLGNELTLIVPKEKQSSMSSFYDLAHKKVNKISIGTPESVPAGKYAKEALENLGLWENIESKVVYAKDVRQVLAYVETGNVDVGIVYKTDALISDKVKIAAPADPEIHTPIVYPVGIIKDSNHYETAKEFFLFLQNETTLKVFEEYGFTIK